MEIKVHQYVINLTEMMENSYDIDKSIKHEYCLTKRDDIIGSNNNINNMK